MLLAVASILSLAICSILLLLGLLRNRVLLSGRSHLRHALRLRLRLSRGLGCLRVLSAFFFLEGSDVVGPQDVSCGLPVYDFVFFSHNSLCKLLLEVAAAFKLSFDRLNDLDSVGYTRAESIHSFLFASLFREHVGLENLRALAKTLLNIHEGLTVILCVREGILRFERVLLESLVLCHGARQNFDEILC